jgi:hypothetical protein
MWGRVMSVGECWYKKGLVECVVLGVLDGVAQQALQNRVRSKVECTGSCHESWVCSCSLEARCRGQW